MMDFFLALDGRPCREKGDDDRRPPLPPSGGGKPGLAAMHSGYPSFIHGVFDCGKGGRQAGPSVPRSLQNGPRK